MVTRFRSCTSIIGVLLIVLVGCSKPIRTAEIAAAKCESAVVKQLQVDDFDTSLRTEDVTVTQLDADKKRVEGRWEHDSKAGSFVCEVVPDDADTLRKLRVTRLDVE